MLNREMQSTNQIFNELLTDFPKDVTPEEILLNPDIYGVGKRDEIVPSEKVFDDTNIVNENQVLGMKKIMLGTASRKGFGQIDPLWLRARLNENGEITYDILDGFHRNRVIKDAGIPTTKAVVFYNIDEETFWDYRVMTTATKKEVKFARMATWMQRSFEQTKWYEKNLKISQIFSLTQYDGPGAGKRLGLSAEEAKEAIEWAKQKADIWGSDVTTIIQNFRIIEVSNPDLVQAVRISSGGGHKGSGSFNPAKLTQIAEALPNRITLQQTMYEIVREHNFGANEIGLLSQLTAKYENERKILDKIISNPESIISLNDQLNGDKNRLEKVIQIAIDQDVEIEEAMVGLQILDEYDNEEIDELEDEPETVSLDDLDEEKFIKENEEESEYHYRPNGRPTDYDKQVTREDLEEQVKALKKSLQYANEQLASNGNGGSIEFWWRILPDLTENERNIMELHLLEGYSIEDLCEKYNLLYNVVDKQIKSAWSKLRIHNEDLKLKRETSSLK